MGNVLPGPFSARFIKNNNPGNVRAVTSPALFSKAPVSVCMIVKNEEKNLRRCLESVRPYVEEICIVDTGSIDSTPEIARSLSDRFETYTECNDSDGKIASFAMARQKSFELATQPWILWVDGDDEVKGAENLASVVAKYEAERGDKPALVMFPYEYSHDQNGNVTCLHYRERLVTPGNAFKWKSPVHEVLTPNVSGTHMFQSDVIRIIHRRTQSNKVIEQGRNLRILKDHYSKVGESDIRLLYYLGLEYGNVGDIGNSIKFHKRYVALSGWDDERFLACLKVAEHYQSIGDYETSVEWSLKALTVREGWAEAYFSLAKSFYFMGQRGGPEEHRNWERCVHFSKLGLSFPPTRTVLFVNPVERDFDIHRYLNIALNKLGDVRGALASVDSALKFRPDDESLLMNRRLYDEFISKDQVSNACRQLLKIGVINQAAIQVIEAAIAGKMQEQVVEPQVALNPVLEPATSGPSVEPSPISSDRLAFQPLNIVFYVGYGAEPWTPDTMAERGIGGSETAVVEMSKRLVKFGHSVRVYGDCPGQEGIYDGVQYIHYPGFKDVKCDVFVTSRRPHIVDDEHGLEARIRLCWVHDIHCGASLTHKRALRIDRFLVLSEWHRSFFLQSYRSVHPSQMIVTRNGIDLSRFNLSVPRNPHRIIYSSSPDRGLDVSMRVMPKIREKVPNAELHIYYGFQTWETSAQGSNDKGQLDLISYLKNCIENGAKHGIVFHGRVNQLELAKEFLSSGVWGYPTWFAETSCLSAMEAQSAGLRIVTSPIAALNETVGDRGVMIHGDWLSPEYHEKFVEAVIDAMIRPEDGDRERNATYAKAHFGMDDLARDWDAMFRRVIEEVERDIVPQYKAVI